MHKLNSGQSLIEVVIAIGIIVVVLVGVSDLISRTIGLSNYQKDHDVAMNLAEKQLIYNKRLLNDSPLTFLANLSSHTTCVEVPSRFTCSISYVPIEPSKGVNMYVTVSWNDGGATRQINLDQVLAVQQK